MPGGEDCDERVTARVAGPCFIFHGEKDSDGYGKVSVGNNRFISAQRLAYILFVGPLLQTDVVRHSCGNPPCILPSHLLKGSWSDSVWESVNRASHFNAAKMVCKHGHEFTEANTSVVRSARGTSRVCRACSRIRSQKQRDAKKEAR